MPSERDVADHFNSELERLRSLGIRPVSRHEDVANAAEPLVARFAKLDPKERDRLRKKLSYEARDVLVGCSSALGASAVEKGTPELLVKALTTLALVDEGNDFRDSYLALQYLHDCARKLEIDPAIFAEAAALVKSDQMRNYFLQFAQR